MCDRWAEVMNSARLRGLFDPTADAWIAATALLLTTRPIVSFVTWKALTALSMRSLIALILNGKTAPEAFLQKRLTSPTFPVESR